MLVKWMLQKKKKKPCFLEANRVGTFSLSTSKLIDCFCMLQEKYSTSNSTFMLFFFFFAITQQYSLQIKLKFYYILHTTRKYITYRSEGTQIILFAAPTYQGQGHLKKCDKQSFLTAAHDLL